MRGTNIKSVSGSYIYSMSISVSLAIIRQSKKAYQIEIVEQSGLVYQKFALV